jgi:hypothetical protein
MFKLIQTCSIEFTVYAEFIVHSAGLSVNLVGLSAKSVGIFSQMNFGQFLPNFTEFDRFFQKLTESEG